MLLPLPPAHRAALAELLRCVSATDPARPIRVSVAHLMQRMSRSRNTVSRYLAALTDAGLIERWQSVRGARRWGFRCAQMRLTASALDLLGLQRAPSAVCVPNPVSQGKAGFARVRRIPQDLADLAQRIGAPRVVWLMARCRAAGRRLQEFAAQALSTTSPAGFVLAALRGRKAAHINDLAGRQAGSTTCGGDSRQDARHVNAVTFAGVLGAAANRERGAAIRAALGLAPKKKPAG